MGNSASQSGNVAQRQQPEQDQQWAHSFPRTPQRLNQHKVLPDVAGDVHQKLRPTNNGEILYSGGTISGRHHNGNLSLSKDELPIGIYRSSSISSKHPQECYDSQDSPKQRYYIPHIHECDQMNRSPLRKNRNLPSELRHPHSHYVQQKEMQMKRFGSVPDLRGRDEVEHTNRDPRDVHRGRKKYKAPPPPTGIAMVTSNGSSLDSWDMGMNNETIDVPIRKARLFKTRAEMKKKPSSPSNNRRSTNHQDHDNKRYRSKSKEPHKKETEKEKNERSQSSDGNYRLSLSEMQRSRSLPEFQAELREATQRLRSSKFKQNTNEETNKQISQQRNKHNVQRYSSYESKDNKLKTLDPNVCKKEHIKYKMKQLEKIHMKELNEDTDSKSSNTRRSIHMEEVLSKRKEIINKEIEQSPAHKRRDKPEIREQPSKTFYFGMDESTQLNSFNSNIVDNFALSIQKYNCVTQTYSGSDLSSEIDIEDNQISSNGIALHLRPILPKKQLEIPRFSPAAAWKLLSAFDSNPPPSTVSDEGPVLVEDRIEKLSRLPPLLSIPGVGPRSSHDKSGDSGISGDAGPPGFEDNSDQLLMISRNSNLQMSTTNCPLNLSWTPQQDLEGEDESSSEGGVNNNRQMYVRNVTNVKFSPRSQVFSLSLPRDNHLAAYMEEKAKLHSPPNFSNLQRLKRSVSGVLGNFSNKKESNPNLSQDQSNNWFLSRSAPNSLNNGFNSLELRLSKHNTNMLPNTTEERVSLVPVNNPTNTNGGRVMYLPECKETQTFSMYQNDSREATIQYKQQTKRDICKPVQNNKEVPKNNRITNLSKSCENISSGPINKSTFEPENLQDPPAIEVEKWKGRKPKRFTFQSTVRQIERRRLAEKLSREAERKEKQRLSELEAMRRVEEEFQRKRAKEKASIRQQLRLFSLDDTVWTSLPPNWDNKEVPARSEPDGAVSSTSSSPILDNTNTKLLNNGFSYGDIKNENIKMNPAHKNTDNKSNPAYNKILARQGSESSDDAKVKAQATQVLSEYRQPRREYKDYRTSSRCVGESNDSAFHDSKQTTIHPQVIYNMPKVHGQGSNVESSSKSNNYRRDFAHGIMLPTKNAENFPEDLQSNIKKHSPRITQNQRTRQGKCIS